MLNNPSSTGYFGGYHRGGDGQYRNLLKWCTHAVWDLRFYLAIRAHPPILLPGSPIGGGGGASWRGDSHRFRSASSQYWDITTNIADAISELFVIARVRFEGSGAAHPFGRGADAAAGNGWSLQTILTASEATFHVVTTSGGAALKTATSADTRAPGQWYTYMAAYKSGSYVKVGVDGIWLDTESIATTGIRSSSQGLSVNRNNSLSATGNFDIKMLGIGTTIPADQDLLTLHREIMALEDVYADNRVLLAPPVQPVVSSNPNPVVWFH